MIRNMARCRQCKDIIESKFRHDFVTCKCGAISVDGGSDYQRIVGNIANVELFNEKTQTFQIVTPDAKSQ